MTIQFMFTLGGENHIVFPTVFYCTFARFSSSGEFEYFSK